MTSYNKSTQNVRGIWVVGTIRRSLDFMLNLKRHGEKKKRVLIVNDQAKRAEKNVKKINKNRKKKKTTRR